MGRIPVPAPRGHDARQSDTAPPTRRIPCRAILPAATPQLSNVSTFHIFFLKYRLFSIKCQEKSLPGPHFTDCATGHAISRLNGLLRRHSCSAKPRCDIRRRIPISRNGQNHGRTCAQPGILKKTLKRLCPGALAIGPENFSARAAATAPTRQTKRRCEGGTFFSWGRKRQRHTGNIMSRHTTKGSSFASNDRFGSESVCGVRVLSIL